MTGEIAIRNGYHGETSFYILPRQDDRLMQQILQASCLDSTTQSILCGWLDYEDDAHFVADLRILNKKMEELIVELKQRIIEALNLEEMTPDDIDTDAPLFGEDGLGLDSIDALELIVLMEKRYGIKLASPAEGKAIFKSVRTIAEFVNENRKK